MSNTSTTTDEPEDGGWVKKTRVFRWIVAGGSLLLASVLAISEQFNVCETVVSNPATGATRELCRSPVVTDLAVLAPFAFLAVLVLPEVQLGLGGFSIRSRLKETEGELKKSEATVESLRAEILTTATSNSIATAHITIAPDRVPGSAPDQESWTWIGRLIDVEFDQLQSSLQRQLPCDRVDVKVYRFADDGSLTPMFTSSDGAIDLVLLTFESGTGVVGFAARHRSYWSVVGIDEIAGDDNVFRLRDDQRKHFAAQAENGMLAPVVAGVPLVNLTTGATIGALTVDVHGPQPAAGSRDALDATLRDEMVPAAFAISSILIRVGSV